MLDRFPRAKLPWPVMVLPRRELVSEIGFKMAESVQHWQREIVDVMSHIDGKHFTIDSWGNEHRSGTRSVCFFPFYS
jgi:hypothetical protein